MLFLFFCHVYPFAAGWAAEHPEWHALLADEAAALRGAWGSGAVGTNPFLHLSMHLSLSEQCSIDQPRGIRRAIDRLAERLGDLHAAHHAAMQPLGQMLADAAASGQPPDGQQYVEQVQRLAG